MSFQVTISDNIAGNSVKVSPQGQLITSPISYSTFYNSITVTANIAVNVIKPLAGYNFIITAIAISGGRAIGVNGAVVDLFENSTGPTNATVNKSIYQDDITRQTRSILSNVNIIVTSGRWVNIKSDDVQVRANIAGYYLSVV